MLLIFCLLIEKIMTIAFINKIKKLKSSYLKNSKGFPLEIISQVHLFQNPDNEHRPLVPFFFLLFFPTTHRFFDLIHSVLLL